MRASIWFSGTLKETPADAEIISHQLMLRAGLIRKLGAGLYSWLPTGLKILHNIEKIVREEMNKANALEVLMPSIQPAELWQETRRWDDFGDLLLKIKDNNNRDYCFGPTHEEVITNIMRDELKSYKQLPINFYQIQTKFRDEIRPRFGVMRAREFIMKDAYSFHLTSESLEQTYETMKNAYCQIFERLGLKYRAVEADTGAIGGSGSHEFQVLADTGEDLIAYSDSGDYAANIEQATNLKPEITKEIPTNKMELIHTPDQKTINDLVNFINVDIKETVKTLIVQGEKEPLIALILRGDDTLNEIKAQKHPWIKSPIKFIDETHINKTLNLPFGSIGPVNLGIPIIADFQTLAMKSFVCGANQKDYHYTNVSWTRDAKYDDSFDLRNVKEGDLSPDGKGQLKICRGIEVGHIFQLGDKYSKAMKAEVLNEKGELQNMLMGCYGLGVSRVVAAAIEQNHDEFGIIWPNSMAPFQVVIIPINAKRSENVREKAELLYQELLNFGVDVLLDDRDERPGILFADNDLIGIPHRLVISDKNLKDNVIEYKARKNKDAQLVQFTDIQNFIFEKLGLDQL